jgi:hypothetical protein
MGWKRGDEGFKGGREAAEVVVNGDWTDTKEGGKGSNVEQLDIQGMKGRSQKPICQYFPSFSFFCVFSP